MLTGVKPYEAPYESAVLYAIINVDPKPPREYNSDIPEPLEEIVLCCLAKDPASAKNPISAPFGEKNGPVPPSVPARGMFVT